MIDYSVHSVNLSLSGPVEESAAARLVLPLVDGHLVGVQMSSGGPSVYLKVYDSNGVVLPINGGGISAWTYAQIWDIPVDIDIAGPPYNLFLYYWKTTAGGANIYANFITGRSKINYRLNMLNKFVKINQQLEALHAKL